MTVANYRLDAYDTSGVLQFQLTDFINLAYLKRVNFPGLLQFAVKGDHDLTASIGDKWQFEVWRRPTGEAWGRDFTGLFRQPRWTHGNSGSIFVAHCPGLMSMLGWRHILWAADTTNRTKFASTAAETIMKTLVDYNAGPNATVANGRKREGAISGLSVEADGANGNSQPWYCFGKNLLENLQDLAKIAGGDFDLVKTSATTWEFRWYTGQLGTDRSSTITFALERGNMADPEYVEKRIQEATAAGVWGQGEGSDRDYVTRTGTNYDVNDNNIEMFVDARNVDAGDTAGLNAKGDLKLDEVEARNEFSFRSLQAPQTLYGVDYGLGDLVTAINPFTAASLTLKVESMSVTLDSDGNEEITPGFVTA